METGGFAPERLFRDSRRVARALSWTFVVVGTGVDPVTSRFSGALYQLSYPTESGPDGT